ncbi:MAG: ATP-grasp domain-containing protein [Dehalococcoidia bacterium]|nr:ATP-grasp domain-containing protein [Dehalococcoidia bacterium]
MHRILLLLPGNTYRANAFIQAANKANVELIIGTDTNQVLSQKLPERYITLNFHELKLSIEKINTLANKKKIHKILAVDDQGVLLASLASKKLNLTQNSFASVNFTRNKFHLYKLIESSDINSIETFLLNRKESVHKIKKFTFPIVIKPIGLSASRGVMRVNNKNEFDQKTYQLFNLLSNELANECFNDFEKDNIIIQKYIPGKEYAIEGIIENQQFKLLAIFEKPIPLTGPFFEESIYISDPNIEKNLKNKIQRISQQYINLLGLNEGAVHIEIRKNKYGIFLVDIAARSIGGYCSEVLQFPNQTTLEEIILKNSLGKKYDGVMNKDIHGVMMIPTSSEGTLQEILGIERAKKIKLITHIKIAVHKGKEIKKLPKANTYLGFIFAKGNNKNEVMRALQNAHKHITVKLK